MLMTLLEVPVAALYAITGNKKLENLCLKMKSFRKKELDSYIQHNPQEHIENYKQAELGRLGFILSGIAVCATVFVVIPILMAIIF